MPDVMAIATDTTLSALVSGGAVQIAKRAKTGITGEVAYRLMLAFAGMMGGLQWAATVSPVAQVAWGGIAAVVGTVFMADGQFQSYRQRDTPPQPPPERIITPFGETT